MFLLRKRQKKKKKKKKKTERKKEKVVYSLKIMLTLKALITTGRRHFQSMFFVFFRENNA